MCPKCTFPWLHLSILMCNPVAFILRSGCAILKNYQIEHFCSCHSNLYKIAPLKLTLYEWPIEAPLSDVFSYATGQLGSVKHFYFLDFDFCE